ncbi:MAG: hypothetical protein ACI4F6_06295 [Acutalibacteraceae bacterium]
MTNGLILEFIIYFSMMVLICINVYAGVQYHKTRRRIYVVVMVLSTVLCLSGAIKAGMLIYDRI